MKLRSIIASILVSASIMINGCIQLPPVDFSPQSSIFDKTIFIRNLEEQTVYIDTYLYRGTGIVIYQDNEKALILTARHCLVDTGGKVLTHASIYPPTFENNLSVNKIGYPSVVEQYSSKELDLAILRYDVKKHGKFKSVATLLEKNILPVGSNLYHCGHPRGMEAMYTEGVISSYHDNGHYSYMTFTTFIDHGSSGGGMYSSDGKMAGICQMLFFDKIGGALTSYDICKWLRDIHYDYIIDKK